MTESQKDRVPRLFVFGSCVSRDAVERLGPGSYELRRYIARQSVISVGHDASEFLPTKLGLQHAFQERMVVGDWRGDLWEQIDSAGEFDLLLWDLVDERHGVYWFMNGGVATRSVDALSAEPVAEVLPGEQWVPFGDEMHFEAWKEAVSEFSEGLRKRGLWEKVVVIKVPWAVEGRNGESVPPSLGLSASQANQLFEPYYSYLEALGFDVLSVAGDVFGDSEHRWGLAPFHYIPEVYDEIDAGILQRFGALES
ncbi:DUF6270 domain-containing protein [Kocuria sp. TGY1127_2]|uniref:DUF6270 domain-containing protein n=1 Tax=Kocuria sp. TGY1127_2 TaxID=2711328 RepID=UPI0015BDBC7F|nr:DUF6270 domain-containing protein [Kocuria sp. TGY1127_2]